MSNYFIDQPDYTVTASDLAPGYDECPECEGAFNLALDECEDCGFFYADDDYEGGEDAYLDSYMEDRLSYMFE